MSQAFQCHLSTCPTVPDALLQRLGPSRFTAEDQAANPQAPMTRVAKDVLRTGTFRCSAGQFKVKPGTLGEMAKQYKLARSRGLQSNLYWGNERDSDQHNVKARDAIAPIDELVVHGDRLFAVQYVTPEKAVELSNPAHRVSIKAVRNWTDGENRTYPWFMEHVAIVDQPVVAAQGDFFQLANEGPDMLPELRDVLNEMLDLMGLSSIGEDIGEADILTVLRTKVATLRELTQGGSGSGTEEAEMAKEAEAKLALDADDKSGTELTELRELVLSLTQEVKGLVSQKQEDEKSAAKIAYELELNRLFEGQQIDAATLEQYQQVGEVAEFKLSLLAPLKALPKLNADGDSEEKQIGEMKLANEPDTGGTKGRSDEEVNKDLKERGLKPMNFTVVGQSS